MSKLVNVYFDVSMSNGHSGLKNIVKADNIADGECVVFVNKNRLAMKMLTPDNVLLHYKSPSRNRPIVLDTIKYLPSCVNGQSLNYNRALKKALQDRGF